MGFVYGDPLSVFMFLVFLVPGTGVRCHVLVGMQVCNGTTTSSAALAAGLQGTTVLRLSHIHNCHLFVSFVLPVFFVMGIEIIFLFKIKLIKTKLLPMISINYNLSI